MAAFGLGLASAEGAAKGKQADDSLRAMLADRFVWIVALVHLQRRLAPGILVEEFRRKRLDHAERRLRVTP